MTATSSTVARTSALLIVDMLSSWDFPDADKLLPGATRIAPRIAQLAERCRQSGLPVVFANDNHGKWRSELGRVVAAAKAAPGPAGDIARQLEPRPMDYVVLKPRHSCFYATPLDLLLRDLGVRQLILAGVSSDQCVLYTAADARMRDYELLVARDCVASQSDERNDWALRHFEQALDVATPAAAEIELA